MDYAKDFYIQMFVTMLIANIFMIRQKQDYANNIKEVNAKKAINVIEVINLT